MIPEAVQSTVKRLNSREPQYPPDMYYIKRNRSYLLDVLKEPSKFNHSPEFKFQ
jgi:hypothetical protein